jgi:4,5-dihydroxyphthalate decarboxylase
MMADKLRLRTALGKHAHVVPLRDGRVASPRLELEFIDIEPLPKAFRQMVRGDDLDVSEMAVVTHLLAHHFGRPIRGLAIPLWSRLPHTNLVCPIDSNVRDPRDLDGKSVGVRAYAQTSGVWVRGVLKSEYGVNLDSILWGTMEDAHLPEYVDPPNTKRYTAPPTLRELMMRGEFAAIMGEREVDPKGIRPVIPDATATAYDWIKRSGIHPINHILTVKNEILAANPWLGDELMEMFTKARNIAIVDGAAPPPAYGFEANAKSLQRCFDFSADQKITPRIYNVSELFLKV